MGSFPTTSVIKGLVQRPENDGGRWRGPYIDGPKTYWILGVESFNTATREREYSAYDLFLSLMGPSPGTILQLVKGVTEIIH